MKYNKIWYDSLNKPFYLPPAELFSPVWFILYLSMILSLIVVLSKGFSYIALFSYILFFIQLGLNLFWPIVFFEKHNLKMAFFVSLLLMFFVAITMILFFTISKLAGILLLPYFLWCSFATILCFDIYKMN